MSSTTEFVSAATAEAYDDWLRAKVAESLADPGPTVPHDVVMAEMDAIIAAAEARKLAKA